MDRISSIVRLLVFFTLLCSLGAPQATAMHEEKGSNPSEQDAAVYPNPAQDFVFVRVDRMPFSWSADADITIEIVDILGNPMKVQPEQVNPTTYRIDLSQFPSGYYLLVAHCANCADTEKGLFKFLKQ